MFFLFEFGKKILIFKISILYSKDNVKGYLLWFIKLVYVIIRYFKYDFVEMREVI